MINDGIFGSYPSHYYTIGLAGIFSYLHSCWSNPTTYIAYGVSVAMFFYGKKRKLLSGMAEWRNGVVHVVNFQTSPGNFRLQLGVHGIVMNFPSQFSNGASDLPRDWNAHNGDTTETTGWNHQKRRLNRRTGEADCAGRLPFCGVPFGFWIKQWEMWDLTRSWILIT